MENTIQLYCDRQQIYTSDTIIDFIVQGWNTYETLDLKVTEINNLDLTFYEDLESYIADKHYIDFDWDKLQFKLMEAGLTASEFITRFQRFHTTGNIVLDIDAATSYSLLIAVDDYYRNTPDAIINPLIIVNNEISNMSDYLEYQNIQRFLTMISCHFTSIEIEDAFPDFINRDFGYFYNELI